MEHLSLHLCSVGRHCCIYHTGWVPALLANCSICPLRFTLKEHKWEDTRDHLALYCVKESLKCSKTLYHIHILHGREGDIPEYLPRGDRKALKRYVARCRRHVMWPRSSTSNLLLTGGLAAVIFTDALQTVIMIVGATALAIMSKYKLLRKY